MSDIFGKLKSGAGKVAKEADRIAHVKRIEIDIGSLEKHVRENYQKLGEMFYRSSVDNVPEGPEAENIIAKINELKEQIKAKREEIAKINQGEVAPQAETPPVAPGKKVCPSCGKEHDENVRFCPECGAKLE
jgi:DNA repair exonuclease SbcCD ATPase subunit